MVRIRSVPLSRNMESVVQASLEKAGSICEQPTSHMPMSFKVLEGYSPRFDDFRHSAPVDENINGIYQSLNLFSYA